MALCLCQKESNVGLNPTELRAVTARLDAHHNALLEEARGQLRLAEQIEPAGTQGAGHADSAEAAEADVEMELTAQLLDRHARDLRAILEAQARIADGLFGLCIDCGEDIGYERLLALPAASRCVACQEKHDARLAHHAGSRM